MDYRNLGRSGLRVSPLCLGTMNFGGPTDEATAGRIIARAKEAGVNFIDTADAYTGGKSEEIVGRAIRADRDAWVLATKVANPIQPDANGGGTSRKWIMRAAEASLRRLGTDYIDVYYLHKEDHATPLEETVRAMGDLVRDGKVRYFGVSNYRAWRVAEICAWCDRVGLARPVVSQPYYHALNRVAELEQLPACAFYGLGVFSYSPLGRGILTGKYDPAAPPPADTRAGRHDRRMLQTEWQPHSLRLAQEIAAHAAAAGVSPEAFAVRWVLNNRLVTGIVAGPRTEAQWESYLAALQAPFTAADEAFVTERVPAGHHAVPGYNDPAYPIEGRQPLT
ncbi:MAG: aldo/keto reductase [Acetobacteraceae bacterium]|nr:aldo/keto reductase [Acetobacteraceae bacterium]